MDHTVVIGLMLVNIPTAASIFICGACGGPCVLDKVDAVGVGDCDVCEVYARCAAEGSLLMQDDFSHKKRCPIAMMEAMTKK